MYWRFLPRCVWRVEAFRSLDASVLAFRCHCRYDLITQLPDVPNPQHFCINAGGDSGFPVPPASSFNPSNLSTDNWMAAASAANAGYTLLVASHCSGFLQWQSNVSHWHHSGVVSWLVQMLAVRAVGVQDSVSIPTCWLNHATQRLALTAGSM